MSSPLKQTFVDAFTSTFLPLVGGGETVVNGDKTALGIVEYTTQSDFSDGNMLEDTVSGVCQVIADNIGTLSYARVVTIGTRSVFVTESTTDLAGAITTFRFTSTKPIADGDTI